MTVVGEVSISCGVSLGFTLVDLGDAVAGSGSVYALEGRSTGNGVVVRSISIGNGSIRSEELRFSFGLSLVVSTESVSAIRITVVSTISIISTVTVSVGATVTVVPIPGISSSLGLSFGLGSGISHSGEKSNCESEILHIDYQAI